MALLEIPRERLSHHQREMLSVIESLLEPYLSSNRATVHSGLEGASLLIKVEPTNAASCPFSVEIPPSPKDLLLLETGEDQRVIEIWERDEARFNKVELCLEALLRGGYREEWKRSWWLLGLAIKFTGTFETSSEPARYRRLGGEGLRGRPMRKYEPY